MKVIRINGWSTRSQLLRDDHGLGYFPGQLTVSFPKEAPFWNAPQSVIVIGCYGSWSNCTLRNDRDFGRALFERVPYLCSSC